VTKKASARLGAKEPTPVVCTIAHAFSNLSLLTDLSVGPLERLLTGNAHYANKQTAKNPDAFAILSKGQTPQILWIGCADSRIPETTICHCKPGDIFVHRNIANTIHADDYNAASVVEYAVTHLKVDKVVICGHTKCGGAMASLTDTDLGETLNRWLHPLRE
jgi:carbonic anhydrase